MENEQKMEHRLSVRKPVEAEVTITGQGMSPQSYTTGDISLEGMFIKTDSSSFAKDDFLEVELEVANEGETEQYRITAVVVHTSSNGIGLMFCACDPRLFQVIEKVCYGSVKHRQETLHQIQKRPYHPPLARHAGAQYLQ